MKKYMYTPCDHVRSTYSHMIDMYSSQEQELILKEFYKLWKDFYKTHERQHANIPILLEQAIEKTT